MCYPGANEELLKTGRRRRRGSVWYFLFPLFGRWQRRWCGVSGVTRGVWWICGKVGALCQRGVDALVFFQNIRYESDPFQPVSSGLLTDPLPWSHGGRQQLWIMFIKPTMWSAARRSARSPASGCSEQDRLSQGHFRLLSSPLSCCSCVFLHKYKYCFFKKNTLYFRSFKTQIGFFFTV